MALMMKKQLFCVFKGVVVVINVEEIVFNDVVFGFKDEIPNSINQLKRTF